MGQANPPDSIRSLFKSISEILGYPAVLVSYLLAISGRLPGPAPVTTAIATILVTSLFVVGWRRGAILRQKEKPAQSGGILLPPSVKTAPEPPIRRFFDPISSHSRLNYALSLPRRRVESGLLVGILLLSTYMIAIRIHPAIGEFAPPQLTCSSDSRQPHRILITNFQESESKLKLNLENRLYNFLVEHQMEGQFEVCRWNEPAPLSTQAKGLAKDYQADMVVWGMSGEIYEVHLEVPAWESLNRTLTETSWEEASTADFVISETPHLGYLTEFALSEMVYLNGDTEKARVRLDAALEAASHEQVAPLPPADIAQGYFLLGLMYDPPGNSAQADPRRAIDAYSKALQNQDDLNAARLNRGILRKAQGLTQEAKEDFTLLIERKTKLLGSAYINRAFLQSDPKAQEDDLSQAIALTQGVDRAEVYSFRGSLRFNVLDNFLGAVDDFQQAIKLDSNEFFYYYMLGEAQLKAGQIDAARATFRQIVPLLNTDTRQVVLDQLGLMATGEPPLASVIGEISSELKSAQIPNQTP